MARSHVTKREVAAIEAFAADLMATMRMPAWRIKVLTEPCDDDAFASIDWPTPRHIAELRLSDEWMKIDYDERREVITHEVLHLAHARVSNVVHDDSQSLMHDHDHEAWWGRVTRELELMVDHLASWMADTHTLREAWDAAHD